MNCEKCIYYFKKINLDYVESTRDPLLVYITDIYTKYFNLCTRFPKWEDIGDDHHYCGEFVRVKGEK
jgi:hypothetical protein